MGPRLAGTRRQARERVLTLLYEADVKGVSVVEVVGELPVPPVEMVSDLVTGVAEHLVEIDGLISNFARDWTLDRMPAIDRSLLRMGVLELAHRPDVPTAVVLAEAVELAQQYSTDDSGRFVNGVLAAIAASLRPAGVPEAAVESNPA